MSPAECLVGEALVVEDDPALRLYLASLLKKWGYRVQVAADGAEAWERLQRIPMRLIVSDWMMPRLSGLELCRRIRAAEWEDYVYIILVTARDRSDDLVLGMQAGADDFVAKPIDVRELQVRVEAAARVLNLQAELAQRNRKLSAANAELREAQQRLAGDLEAAAAMQSGLLPVPAQVAGCELRALFLPATIVGGDLYGYRELEDQRVVFYIVDVSGHGVPAAMLAFSVSRMLEAPVGEGNPLWHDPPVAGSGPALRAPHEAVAALNRRFQSQLEDSPYFTMILGLLDVRTGELQLCRAGHPGPIVVDPGGAFRYLTGRSFPVGLLPEAEYSTEHLALHPGERLYVYTDGVTECHRSETGNPFGEQRLAALLADGTRQCLADVIGRVEHALRCWRMSGDYDDDITILALDWKGQV